MDAPTVSATVAVFSLAVAAFAVFVYIWREWILTQIGGPKLVIEPLDPDGTIDKPPNGSRGRWYHLTVRNHRRSIQARNCRVFIRKYKWGEEKWEAPIVPLQLQWTPEARWLEHKERSIVDAEPVDLGYVGENGTAFVFGLYQPVSSSDRTALQRGQSVRLALEPMAEYFVAKEFQGFEVSFASGWTGNLETLPSVLTVRYVGPIPRDQGEGWCTRLAHFLKTLLNPARKAIFGPCCCRGRRNP